MTETANGTRVPRGKAGELEEAETDKNKERCQRPRMAITKQCARRRKRSGEKTAGVRTGTEIRLTRNGRRRRFGKNIFGTVKTGSNTGGAEQIWTEEMTSRIMKTRNIALSTHAERGQVGSTGPLNTPMTGGHRST